MARQAPTAELLFVVLLFAGFASSQARVQFYNWTIEYAVHSPDCVQKLFPTINGQYPGPEVRGTIGDIFLVKVFNKLNSTVTIHWHGIYMVNTPWMDGSSPVTQCTLPPGQSFTYQFSTYGQQGTHWYHAHNDYLRTSIYGGLILDPPEPPPYATPAGESLLLLNDWYHKDQLQMVHDLEYSNGTIAQPDALVINGRGPIDCANYKLLCAAFGDPCLPCDDKSSDCKRTVVNVEAGKTYLLRLINVGMYGMFNFQLEGHNITVVEADGNYLKPVEFDSLNLLPGQTFGVLFTANKPVANYWISQLGNFGTSGGGTFGGPNYAILHYAGAPATGGYPDDPTTPKPTRDPTTDDVFGPNQQLKFKNLYNVPNVNRKTDRNIVLRWDQVIVGNMELYALNNISFKAPETPLLHAAYYDIPGVYDFMAPDIAPPYKNATTAPYPPAKFSASIFEFQPGDYVQIILVSNVAIPHPWHIHGMDFYVVGHGDGTDYDPAKQAQYEQGIGAHWNSVDPPLRNTVSVYSYNAIGNWIAIRFVAENLGVWHSHCHLEPHVHLGMQTAFKIGKPKYGPPPGDPVCGLVPKNAP